MAVQFILGRSGTGKTTYCVNAILKSLQLRADETPLILLVPEQATYQAQRAILAANEIDGYSRLGVLSFERLGFLLAGKNLARRQISRIGAEMIVHRILRQNRHKLKAFASAAVLPGLADKLTDVIIEMHQYGKDPDSLDELVLKLTDSASIAKFSDIALVFKEYLRFIEPQFANPDIHLTNAVKAVGSADFLKGAKIWVDGFSGFTGQELEMLAELIKASAETSIALCLDPAAINVQYPELEEIDPTGLFNSCETTYKELVEIVRKLKLPLADAVVLDRPRRFSKADAIEHVERNIFAQPMPKPRSAAGAVKIVPAAKVRTEVEYVAREICSLVRDRKLRFRDIAVIASDIDTYQHYIQAVLNDFQIPFFIDRRRTVQQYPVVKLLASALAAATEGFASSDIFGCLKSDLVQLSRYEVDLLENYCTAFGIERTDWKSNDDWHFAPSEQEKLFDEELINDIRRRAFADLKWFAESLCETSEIGADKFIETVRAFLARLGVVETISSWMSEATEKNDFAAADEHRQFLEQLEQILAEFVEIFGSCEMPLADLISIFNSAISRISLALIPPKFDEVLVGSIERSRHPELKAVFLIGASQKQFPVPFSYDSILDDADRSAAEAEEFELAPAVSEQLTTRRYLAYIAFTRPGRFLYVTYPAADEKGAAVQPSSFVDDLQSLFTDAVEETYCGPDGMDAGIYSENELTDVFCEMLGKDSPLKSESALNRLAGSERFAPIGKFIREAVNYSNEPVLDTSLAGSIFAGAIALSNTRLSSFASCPYKHFAEYVLALKKRQLFRFEPLDMGQFYHTLLDKLFHSLKTHDESFSTVSNERLGELLDVEIAALIESDPFITNFIGRSPHNAYIIISAGETIGDCAVAMARMSRAGSFKQIASELAFGMDKGLAGYAIKLSSGQRIILRGKIDRVDISDGSSVVFDYKLNGKEVDFSKIYHGLDMQLPIYMLTMQGKKIGGMGPVEIAGAFYLPIRVRPQQGSLSNFAEMGERFQYKANGIFDGRTFELLDGETKSGSSEYYNVRLSKNDSQYGYYGTSGVLKPADFQKFLAFAETKIAQLGERIISGIISIEPYMLSRKIPCTFCSYKPLCRFDWQINDYNRLQHASKADILNSMGPDNG